MDQELVEELSCGENGEDPFRTSRTLIRNKSSEACWSAFSARLGDLYCPNRDYLCEGFSALLSGSPYKILDAYAIGLLDGSKNPIELSPKAVNVTPWSATYSYSFSSQSGSGILEVAYFLSHGVHPALVTRFHINAADDVAQDAEIIVRPLISLSPACSADCTQDISAVATEDKSLLCTSPLACVGFGSETAIRAIPLDVLQQWDCKLGFGERKNAGSGFVPKPARATSRIAGEIGIALKGKDATLVATAFLSGQEPQKPGSFSTAHQSADLDAIAAKFSGELAAAKALWGEKESGRLAWRMYDLAHNFDFEAAGVRGFDAGSMWFRQLWLRDAFEALHSNFNFFFRCEPGKVRSLILAGLSMQDPAGIIPTRIGGAGDKASNGLDSTLLCMLCGCRYYELSGDAQVAEAVSHALKRFLCQASGGKHAVALDYGLLSCPANYSWMDSCSTIEFGGAQAPVPRRIPLRWLGTTLKEQWDAAQARYLLVEVNALWVALLRHASRLSLPRKNELDWLYRLSQRNFYEVFSAGGGLAHIASARDPFALRDTSFSSASVAAYSLVPHLFRKAELSRAFGSVQQNLVYRNGLAFGIPARAGAGFEDGFEDDGQYHGFVCWPRDNPYLYKFLLLCNRPDLAGQLLRSSLEQEFSESAVGYCPELFALDKGKQPVPVKNPAQLWSHFVDPYLDFFKEKK
ncbi:MAG: amylo-alpha-1,6-glucosidase [Candidatus Micrarchaeia archaeon]